MNREIEEKSAMVTFMGKSKALLKSMKYTAATVQEIMGDLMTNRKTTMAMVGIMAVYYNRPIWIVSEKSRCYLEFLARPDMMVDANNLPILVYQGMKPSSSNKVYSVLEEATEATIQEIRDTILRLESWEKPLKGASAYKLPDLENIVALLGLSAPEGVKKWKKTDMYHAIQVSLALVFA
jgi:hypothetical protein